MTSCANGAPWGSLEVLTAVAAASSLQALLSSITSFPPPTAPQRRQQVCYSHTPLVLDGQPHTLSGPPPDRQPRALRSGANSGHPRPPTTSPRCRSAEGARRLFAAPPPVAQALDICCWVMAACERVTSGVLEVPDLAIRAGSDAAAAVADSSRQVRACMRSVGGGGVGCAEACPLWACGCPAPRLTTGTKELLVNGVGPSGRLHACSPLSFAPQEGAYSSSGRRVSDAVRVAPVRGRRVTAPFYGQRPQRTNRPQNSGHLMPVSKGPRGSHCHEGPMIVGCASFRAERRTLCMHSVRQSDLSGPCCAAPAPPPPSPTNQPLHPKQPLSTHPQPLLATSVHGQCLVAKTRVWVRGQNQVCVPASRLQSPVERCFDVGG